MEPESQIFLTLLSNNSISSFPDNTQSTFSNNTPLPISLTGGDWEIALTSICLNNFRGSFLKRKKQRETSMHEFFWQNGHYYGNYLRRFYSKLYLFDFPSETYTPLKINPKFFAKSGDLYYDVLGDYVPVLYMPPLLMKDAHDETIDTLVQLVKDTDKYSNIQYSSELLLNGEKEGVTVTDINLEQRVKRFISTFEDINETDGMMNAKNLLGDQKKEFLDKYINNESLADFRIEGEFLLEKCLKKIKSMIDYDKIVKTPTVSLKRNRRGYDQFNHKTATTSFSKEKISAATDISDVYQEGEILSDIISNEEMIFININICEPRAVGNKLIRCVKILPIKNIAKENLFFEFKKPEYYKIENYYFDHLTVALRNDMGDPIRFFDSDFPIICTFNLRRKKVI